MTKTLSPIQVVVFLLCASPAVAEVQAFDGAWP
jgi:hypothetical protein